MAVNKTAVALEIEKLKKTSTSGTYLEALLNYCDIYNVNYEKPQSVNALLTDTLKKKLEDEANFKGKTEKESSTKGTLEFI